MISFNSLSIYYQNVRGLRTKSHSFLTNVLHCNYDIILLTETWLTPDYHDAEFFFTNYNVFRRDRNAADGRGARGGGVLIAVRRELNARHRTEWSSGPTAEVLWVTIELGASTAPTPYSSSRRTLHASKTYTLLHLACCYFPHGNTHSDSLRTFYDCTFDILQNNQNDGFLVIGDFNVTNALWYNKNESDQSYGLNTNNDDVAADLSDFMNLSNLHQFNGCTNSNGRILDLVLCNNMCTVVNSTSPLTPEDSHHQTLDITLNLSYAYIHDLKEHFKLIYHAADFDSISTHLLSVNWAEEMSNLNTEDAVAYFYNFLNRLITNHIPKKLIKSHSNYPPWYSRTLIKLIRQKMKMHSKWKKYQNNRDYQLFSDLRYREKQLERECYKRFISFSEDNITIAPKYFWTFIKSKFGTNNIPAQMRLNNVSSSDLEKITNMFSEYFDSVFIPQTEIEAHNIIVPNTDSPSLINISSVEITQTIVLKHFEQIDANKGAGYDGVHPILIKRLSKEFSIPLTLIYQKSIAEGCFPDIWKKAIITPIPKGGDKQDIKQYRPISKLNIFGKVFEKIVTNFVTSQMSHIISAEQHGFIRNRSVNTNLILYTDFLINALDAGYQIDAVYTDFSKAFDKINHSILIKKLSKIGIHGDLLRWICSYINNRSQAVALKGYCSGFTKIPSGIPQGSHLGPFLFTLYINDIGTCFTNCNHLLYADDTKIYKIIKAIDDCQSLQLNLKSFEQYCNANQLFLNADKCCIITFSRKRHPLSYDYTISGKPIKRVTEIRDLGVTLDSKLQFNLHIEKIVAKAFKRLGLIIRLCKPFSRERTLKILYNAYVRSILEFGSVIWNPQYAVHIQRIEKIQKKFIKSLDYNAGTSYTDYEDSLSRHNMQMLCSRRNYLDTIFLFKIINNYTNCSELLSLILFKIPRSISSRSNDTFYISFCHTNYAKNTFIRRSCSFYNNNLNGIDIFSCTLNIYKRQVCGIIF